MDFTISAHESSFQCKGSIRGHTITGPGTGSAKGTVDGNCLTGVGKIASWKLSFPTDGGVQTVDASGGFTYTGPSGEFRSTAYTGLFQFAPLDGTCASGGVTRSLVFLEGTLTVP